MCFSSRPGAAGPQYSRQYDPETGSIVVAEQGVPLAYAKRGITTVADYQQAAQQELSDKQLAAQKAIADQQQAFNQQQFDYQKQLDERQKADAQAQAERQTAYDTGRAQLLQQGAQSVNDAFARFTPDYFTQYSQDYLNKAKDQIEYQKGLAQKDIMFDAARTGKIGSQALANKLGLLTEQEGRTLAEQTDAAQTAANTLRSNVANAKNSLLGQVQSSESIGSPIAASDMGGVGQQLQTQRQAVSGVQNQAGDVVASLNAVPTVSSLGSIFGNLLSAGGSYLAGSNARYNYGNYARNAGLTPF